MSPDPILTSSKINGLSRPEIRPLWFNWLAWIPVILFIITVFVCYLLNPGLVFQSQAILTALNVLFSCSISLLIAYIAARSYLATGSRSVLLLGCGAIIFALINLFAGILITDVNDAFTVYNTGVLLAGFCFMGSAVTALILKPSETAPAEARRYLDIAYGFTILAICLLTLGAIIFVTPDFYVPGQGFTLLRQSVLALAVVEFIGASACFQFLYRQSRSSFLLWYSLGLLIIGISMIVLMVQSDVWSLLAWAGRGGQYLGALYMLAAVGSLASSSDERMPLERALRETEEKYRNIVETASEGIWITDTEAYTTFVNRRMADMLGYSPQEIIGKSMYDFMDDEAIALTKFNLSRRKQGMKGSYEQKYIRKDGTILWAIVSASPLRDKESQVVASLAMLTDITGRKRDEEAKEQLLGQLKERTAELMRINEELEVKTEELAAQQEEIECANEELRTNNDEMQRVMASYRETQDYLESLINYANAPIIVWDPKFTITRFNRAFEYLSGYTANEVLGKDLNMLFPPESREELLNNIKRTIEGERWESVEVPILHKNGGILIALWSSANIYDANNSLIATIAQGQDITARKQAEKDLEDAKTQAELYLDLMGHDISNLHQVMMSQLEMAGEIIDASGKLGIEDRGIIDNTLKTLDRAARLIDNVRKLQKLKSGEFSMETVDVAKVLGDVLDVYSKVPGRSITINYSHNGRCLVRANPLLKDVFSNLVDNAVKHSNGAVEIGVDINEVGMSGNSYYRIGIEDNGNGIPDDKKGELFQRFKRGQTKARGTGLGLYLVKSLVEGFGGYVEVQNRVLGDYTRGTRFLVYVPAIKEESNDR